MKREDYRIAWICALPIELTAALAVLDEQHEPLPQLDGDDNVYMLGRISQHDIVVTCLPAGIYGTTSAAIVASQLRRSFPSIKYGVMVGIGGGVPGRDGAVRLGDAVIATPTPGRPALVQYDLGKLGPSEEFTVTGQLNKPPQQLLSAVSRLQAIQALRPSQISDLFDQAFYRDERRRDTFRSPGLENDVLFHAGYDHQSRAGTCLHCDKTRIQPRSERHHQAPVLHFGSVASGNSVIKHGASRDRLAQRHAVLCFEMEAAGIVDHLPCLVIRGICDYADSHKNKQWQSYAAAVAATCGKAILDLLPPVIRKDTIIRRGDQELHRNVQSTHWLNLLNTLSSYDHVRAHGKIRFSRLNGTAEWFITHATTQKLLRGTATCLIWLSGIIGCGKSVICSRAIDYFLQDNSIVQKPSVAYFYCDALHDHQLDATYILRSLSRQLLYSRLKSGAEPAADLQAQLKKCASLPGPEFIFEEAAELFSYCVTHTRQVVCIIDGIDALKLNEIHRLLKLLDDLSRERHSLSLLLSTRSEIGQGWTIPYTDHINISEADTANDMRAFIDDAVATRTRTQRAITKDPVMMENLKHQLITEGRGMFLWVQLQISTLWETCYSDQQIRDALNNLPRDLPQTYERCLFRIPFGQRIVAAKVLRWIICAYRPLQLHELQEIIAFNTDDSRWDAHKVASAAASLGCCNSLLALNYSDLSIDLVHPSVKQYLQELDPHLDDEFRHKGTNDQIKCAEECISYVNFTDFQLTMMRTETLHRSGPLNMEPVWRSLPLGKATGYFVKRFAPRSYKQHHSLTIATTTNMPGSEEQDESAYGLLDYARKGWVFHSRFIVQNSSCYEGFVALSLQPNWAWALQPWVSRQMSEASYVHGAIAWATRQDHPGLLSLFKHHRSTVQHFKRVCDVPMADDGMCALHAAARLGHEQIVSLLLEACDVNNRKAPLAWTPLHYAVKEGNITITKLLLGHRELDVNLVSDDDDTALCLAAAFGTSEMIRCLIDRGASLHLPSIASNPLVRAVERRNAKPLAEMADQATRVVDVDELVVAAAKSALEKCDELMFETLMRYFEPISEESIPCRSPILRTYWPLITSTLYDLPTDAIRLLVRHAPGRLLKSYQSYQAELLLSSSAVPGRPTPLHEAIQKSDTDRLKVLMQFAGVWINEWSRVWVEGIESGYTPLQFAARANDLEAVGLLLQHPDISVNVHVEDAPLMTAVSVALRYSHIDVAKLISSHPQASGDADIRNSLISTSGSLPHLLALSSGTTTSLHVAVSLGRTDLVRQILSRPYTDVNATDIFQETPLVRALNQSNLAISLLLLEDERIDFERQVPLLRRMSADNKIRALHLAESAGLEELQAKLRDIVPPIDGRTI